MLRSVLLLCCSLFAANSAISADDAPKDTWVYKQSTGELFLNGEMKATGYSGNKEKGGLNNPKKQDEAFVGPIPRGAWTIGKPYMHTTKGPNSMKLAPVNPKLTKRDNFLIHGDNEELNQTASDGCIILGPDQRKLIIDKLKTIDKLLVIE